MRQAVPPPPNRRRVRPLSCHEASCRCFRGVTRNINLPGPGGRRVPAGRFVPQLTVDSFLHRRPSRGRSAERVLAQLRVHPAGFCPVCPRGDDGLAGGPRARAGGGRVRRARGRGARRRLPPRRRGRLRAPLDPPRGAGRRGGLAHGGGREGGQGERGARARALAAPRAGRLTCAARQVFGRKCPGGPPYAVGVTRFSQSVAEVAAFLFDPANMHRWNDELCEKGEVCAGPHLPQLPAETAANSSCAR